MQSRYSKAWSPASSAREAAASAASASGPHPSVPHSFSQSHPLHQPVGIAAHSAPSAPAWSMRSQHEHHEPSCLFAAISGFSGSALGIVWFVHVFGWSVYSGLFYIGLRYRSQMSQILVDTFPKMFKQL